MKKIIIFTFITLLCVGLNSCAVHNFDECYSPVGYHHHHTHFGYHHHVSTSRHYHYYHKPRVKTKYYFSRKYNKNTRKPKVPNNHNHKINKNTHMR